MKSLMTSFFRKLYFSLRLGRSGKYLTVGDIPMYYEAYGRGEPLFMFHGGLSTLETFRFQIPDFSKHYRVILPERPGHGRTRDRDGAYSYEQMADEMAAFIRQMGYSKVKAVGYSDGANLMIPLVLKYPELIDKFVVIGGNFHHRGCLEEFQEELRRVPDGELPPEGIDEKYARCSPDGPGHFVKVYHKVKKLWLTEPNYAAEDIRRISVPGLILAGDHDMIDIRHTLEFYRELPKAELCILPNATHRVIKEYPETANRIILDYLKRPYVPPAADFGQDIYA